MVFFTCNHCGDSLKKNAVEKHYNTKCRDIPIFVTCMDCLKDFRELEYDKHTSCVTELEKYSGKNYVAKESADKGRKKQDSWSEIVRSIINSTEYNMKPGTQNVFRRLQSFDNVPRNKKKFQNFVSNSMRINMKDAGEVWAILEKELQKFKGPKPEAKKNNENGVEEQQKNGDATNSQNELENNLENGNVEIVKTKKKKKSKENGETNGTTTTTEDPEGNHEIKSMPETKNDEQQEIKPKKKSKKRNLDETSIENECEKSVEEPEVSKKKKRKENIETCDDIQPESFLINGKFDWINVIMNYAKDGMTVEKLKKKVLKKHAKLIEVDDTTNINKLEKTFKKYFKKTNILHENDTIKL